VNAPKGPNLNASEGVRSLERAAHAVARGRPLWFSSAVFAFLASVAVCWPVWPGLMNYDGVYAYDTAVHGVRSMVWPPMHAYLFWLSRKAGLASGGVFAFQTFAIFFGVALSSSLVVSTRRGAWAAMFGFAALAVIVVPMLGVMFVQWRDVVTAGFAMLSLALWLLGARRYAIGWVVAGALLVGLAVSLRYNGFALFLFSAPLMARRPFLYGRGEALERLVVLAALAAGLALAGVSTVLRLPDLRPLPPTRTVASIQVFDLLGVSACAGRNYLPLSISRGAPLSAAQVRALYDPRHLQIAFRPHAGIPRLYATQRYLTAQSAAEVQHAWLSSVPRRFGCYLRHRNAVFVRQLGLPGGEVFAPTYGAIDPNPFGLALTRPRAAATAVAFVMRQTLRFWTRPWLLFAAAGVVAGLLALRRDPRAWFAATLLGGACANVAVLYFIGPAADARYIFPSNVICAFILATGAVMLSENRGTRLS